MFNNLNSFFIFSISNLISEKLFLLGGFADVVQMHDYNYYFELLGGDVYR